MRLTGHELDQFMAGVTDRLDMEMERIAFMLSYLLAPHTKKRLKPNDFLSKEHKQRRSERHKVAPRPTSAEEMRAQMRERARAEKEAAWLASPAGRRFLARKG